MFDQTKLLRPYTLFIFCSFILSIFLSVQNINFLGLSFDESLFINAALGGRDEVTFMHKKILDLPVKVYPYIGALKSWLYFPIFKIFGVNNYSVRLPMLFLGYVNIFLIYKITSKYFQQILAIAVIVVLLTDLTFLNLHKIDHGPSAIETFLKLLVLYIITPKNSTKRLAFIFFILLLGVFNKLNFIWFVNALFGLKIFYEFTNLPKSNSLSINIKLFVDRIKMYALYFIFLLIFFLINYTAVKVETTVSLSALVDQIKFQILHLVLVISNYQYPKYNGLSVKPSVFLLINYVLFFVIIFINIIFLFFKKIRFNDPHFYNILILSMLILQLSLTKLAVSIWHVIFLYPFLQIFILNTILILFSQIKEITKYKFSIKYIFTAVFILWVSSNIYAFIDFNKKIKTNCGINLYSPQMNSLIDFVNSRDENTVLSLDWGTQSQLLVSDISGKKYIGLNRITKTGLMDITEKDLDNYNELLIIENISSKVALNFENTNLNSLKKTLSKANLILTPIKQFNNPCGNAVFRVNKVTESK